MISCDWLNQKSQSLERWRKEPQAEMQHEPATPEQQAECQRKDKNCPGLERTKIQGNEYSKIGDLNTTLKVESLS